MHEDFAQQAVTEMPEISRPDPLEMGPVYQLTKDRINAIPPLSNAKTPAWPRIVKSMAKRGQQGDSLFGEVFA